MMRFGATFWQYKKLWISREQRKFPRNEITKLPTLYSCGVSSQMLNMHLENQDHMKHNSSPLYMT